MKASSNGKKLLAAWEGLVTHPYQDSGDAWTIGVGHLLTDKELQSGTIKIGSRLISIHGMTESLCFDLLEQDLAKAERTINQSVKVSLSQNQFDALASFVFNVGIQAFSDSTLLRLLNQGKYNEVPTQLRRWNKDNGKVNKGLTNRRRKEIALWNTLDDTVAV